MKDDNEKKFERIEVFHKGESRFYRDFGEALDYAKKVTQYEDEYNHAYIVRKVKIGHFPNSSHIYGVAWVEGLTWLINDFN